MNKKCEHEKKNKLLCFLMLLGNKNNTEQSFEEQM
jgi:hypothetical protein